MYNHLWAPGIQRRTIRRSPDHPEAGLRLEPCPALRSHSAEAAADSRLHFFGNVNDGIAPISYYTPSPSLAALLPNNTHVFVSSGRTVPVLVTLPFPCAVIRVLVYSESFLPLSAFRTSRWLARAMSLMISCATLDSRQVRRANGSPGSPRTLKRAACLDLWPPRTIPSRFNDERAPRDEDFTQRIFGSTRPGVPDGPRMQPQTHSPAVPHVPGSFCRRALIISPGRRRRRGPSCYTGFQLSLHHMDSAA